MGSWACAVAAAWPLRPAEEKRPLWTEKSRGWRISLFILFSFISKSFSKAI
jgi:hypothetical protein